MSLCDNQLMLFHLLIMRGFRPIKLKFHIVALEIHFPTASNTTICLSPNKFLQLLASSVQLELKFILIVMSRNVNIKLYWSNILLEIYFSKPRYSVKCMLYKNWKPTFLVENRQIIKRKGWFMTYEVKPRKMVKIATKYYATNLRLKTKIQSPQHLDYWAHYWG